jgi:alginate O-acetyltransferase complex protein AlgI
MIFNSATFAVFLLVVFPTYWLLQGRLKAQNLLILVASCVFYGWWDWRFLGLFAISTTTDFLVAQQIAARETGRRRWLLVSLGVNLGILGFFKYFNFFVDSAAAFLTALGLQANLPVLQIVLPVGISFYTFQSLSYSIDVYRRRFEPTRDPVVYYSFVSFFPQLVAGPIERASHLLPQFLSPRRFDADLAKDGMRMILWGLFKKIVVADNLAGPVETIFAAPASMSTACLWVGAFYFALQVYCDFSGYSDIAWGLAKLFGFDVMKNFRRPYFARSLHEFWQRWHISLSSWFRDYVFFPLGGSRVAPPRWALNVMLTFAISGLWHGAAWTFIVWGLVHGLCYLADVAWLGRTDVWVHHHVSRPGRVAYGVLRHVLTLAVVLAAWVFFRAESMPHALTYLKNMFGSEGTDPRMFSNYLRYPIIVLVVEWLFRHRSHVLELRGWPRVARWGLYYGIVYYIFKAGNFQYVPFIYFQF